MIYVTCIFRFKQFNLHIWCGCRFLLWVFQVRQYQSWPFGWHPMITCLGIGILRITPWPVQLNQGLSMSWSKWANFVWTFHNCKRRPWVGTKAKQLYRNRNSISGQPDLPLLVEDRETSVNDLPPINDNREVPERVQNTEQFSLVSKQKICFLFNPIYARLWLAFNQSYLSNSREGG